MDTTDDENMTYEPSEDVLPLYQLIGIVDTVLEQLWWLKVIIDQEIERREEGNLG